MSSVKSFYYKIYGRSATKWDVMYWDVDNWDYNNALLGTLSKEVLNTPSFRKTIDSGSSELKIDLGNKFNNFGEGSLIDFGNTIELYVVGYNDAAPTKIYTGIITSYEPILLENSQHVLVTALGLNYDLSDIVLEDVSGNTAIEYIDEDVADIIKDILDKYQVSGGLVTYLDADIPTTGTTASYTFNLTKVKDALDTAVSLLPAYWYYYVDSTGAFKLVQTSTAAADHKLAVGREIKSINARKTKEQVVNEVYFVGGTPAGGEQLYLKFSRPGSIDAYGRRSQIVIDQRVTLSGTAGQKANKILDEFESPLTRLEVEVVDDNANNLGYDIESIEPGDSIQIQNITYGAEDSSLWDIMYWDVDNWDGSITNSQAEILQIKTVDYNYDSVRIEAGARQPESNRRIKEISTDLVAGVTQDIPIKPV